MHIYSFLFNSLSLSASLFTFGCWCFFSDFSVGLFLNFSCTFEYGIFSVLFDSYKVPKWKMLSSQIRDMSITTVSKLLGTREGINANTFFPCFLLVFISNEGKFNQAACFLFSSYWLRNLRKLFQICKNLFQLNGKIGTYQKAKPRTNEFNKALSIAIKTRCTSINLIWSICRHLNDNYPIWHSLRARTLIILFIIRHNIWWSLMVIMTLITVIICSKNKFNLNFNFNQ